MTGRGVPLFTRTVPKGKEKTVPPESTKVWHRVFYRASQVERSLRPEDFVVGKRLAVLEHRHEFHSEEQMPPCVFYTGVVEKIWGTDSDLVTIKYDAHPFAVNISFGIKHNSMFCIPVSKAKSAKTKKRR